MAKQTPMQSNTYLLTLREPCLMLTYLGVTPLDIFLNKYAYDALKAFQTAIRIALVFLWPFRSAPTPPLWIAKFS